MWIWSNCFVHCLEGSKLTKHEIPWLGLLVKAPLTSQNHEKLKHDFLHDLEVAAPKASRVLAPKAVMMFFLIDAGSSATQ